VEQGLRQVAPGARKNDTVAWRRTVLPPVNSLKPAKHEPLPKGVQAGEANTREQRHPDGRAAVLPRAPRALAPAPHTRAAPTARNAINQAVQSPVPNLLARRKNYRNPANQENGPARRQTESGETTAIKSIAGRWSVQLPFRQA